MRGRLPNSGTEAKVELGMDNLEARRQAETERLGQILAQIPVAILITAEPDGEMHGRPMQMSKTPFDGSLYFFTNELTPKVSELHQVRKVSVVLSDPRSDRYVWISGVASLTREHAALARQWHDDMKTWFPKGLQDPELALIVVDVQRAEYWDTPPTVAVDAWGHLRAAFTGDKYDPGTHGKVDLR